MLLLLLVSPKGVEMEAEETPLFQNGCDRGCALRMLPCPAATSAGGQVGAGTWELWRRRARADPAGFWKEFRQRGAALARALRPEQVVLHLQRLLGQLQASPDCPLLPGRPPPEPPPVAAQTLRS